MGKLATKELIQEKMLRCLNCMTWLTKQSHALSLEQRNKVVAALEKRVEEVKGAYARVESNLSGEFTLTEDEVEN